MKKKQKISKPKESKNNSLHPIALSIFKPKLLALLMETNIESGFISNNEPDWGWQLSKEIQKSRSKYLTVFAVWQILTDQIFDFFPIGKKPSGKLSAVLKANELEKLADQILSYIGSIPLEYDIYFEIGAAPSSRLNLKINSQIEIITVSLGDKVNQLQATWAEAYKGLGQLLGQNPAEAFRPGTTLIKFKKTGYFRDKIDDPDPSSLFSELKVLLYLGAALEVMEERKSVWSDLRTQDNFLYFVSKNDDKVKRIKLPAELGKYISNFCLVNNLIRDTEKQKKFLNLGAFLGADASNKNRKPIFASAEWAIESAATINQTVSFIQICIALEAILGDDHLRDGITKTLGDRCAYLLGHDVETREKLRSEFSALYDKRSKIVHGRAKSLDSASINLLGWGAVILKFILKKEISNFRP